MSTDDPQRSHQVSVSNERAVATFLRDKRPVALPILDGEIVPFGRGNPGDPKHIRIGNWPKPADLSVPRTAGYLIAVNQRIIVDCAEPIADRQIVPVPLLIEQAGESDYLMPVGTAFAPAVRRFAVYLQSLKGSLFSIEIAVRPRSFVPLPLGEPSIRQVITLTEEEREVVRRYREPISDGEQAPASHTQVAAALEAHRNTAANRITAVWDKLWDSGVPMHQSTDKATAVIRTLAAHGIPL